VNALILFLATAGLVFALGLQSLNVNGRHFVAAGCTSFLIGGANLVLFKTLPGPTSGLELAAYLTGGPVGILLAMHLHPRMVRLWQVVGALRCRRAIIRTLPAIPKVDAMPPHDGSVVCLSGASIPLPTIDAEEPGKLEILPGQSDDFLDWVQGSELVFFWAVMATAVCAWVGGIYALVNLGKWMAP
jgi:hypothetical protein